MTEPMKQNFSIKMVISVLLLLGHGLSNLNAEPILQKRGRTRMKVYYEKQSNNDRKISLILLQGSGKNMVGVPKAKIRLTTFNLANELELTILTTDENGEATLVIEAGYTLPKDDDGYTVIKAVYSGNEALKGVKKQIKFMDLNIGVAFDIIDSVKQITISTIKLDSLGNKIPVAGIELKVGVERLYSILYLDKIETNTKGLATMEFPNDIPGDSIGNLNLIIRVEEDDDYGTISKSAKIQWGTIVDYSITTSGRCLYGDQAPLWMIIAVSIILTGAWFHFILAISKVVKMRNIAQDLP
jgi:hypothetical protein